MEAVTLDFPGVNMPRPGGEEFRNNMALRMDYAGHNTSGHAPRNSERLMK